MSNKAPSFPMPQTQHFNDYGFDPQIHHYQVLERPGKHRKKTRTAIDDPLQFKLEKPFSKDDRSNPLKAKTKKHWWRNTLLFFGQKKWAPSSEKNQPYDAQARAIAPRCSISGPVYVTETGSSGSTSRTTSRSNSGPLAGISTPYLSLKELNMDPDQYRVSTSSLPIYLVT